MDIPDGLPVLLYNQATNYGHYGTKQIGAGVAGI